MERQKKKTKNRVLSDRGKGIKRSEKSGVEEKKQKVEENGLEENNKVSEQSGLEEKEEKSHRKAGRRKRKRSVGGKWVGGEGREGSEKSG